MQLKDVRSCQSAGFRSYYTGNLQTLIMISDMVDQCELVAHLESAVCSDPQLALLSSKLQEYKDKADKFYKFKPRKKAATDDGAAEAQKRQLAYRYLVNG